MTTETIETATPKYPNVEVDLSEGDGNAFSILVRVRRAMRCGGVPSEEIEQFTAEAKSGDYDHLLQTAMRWVSTSVFALAALLSLLLFTPSTADAAPCSNFEVDRVFADVPLHHPACAEIESLYHDGLTSGCGVDPDGTRYFCPSAPLTRAQGAMFSEHRDPFAQLSPDGRIEIANHVVTAERFDKGHYWIQFSRNIQRCSVEGWSHDYSGPTVEVDVDRLFGTIDTVEVFTSNGGSSIDMWFNIRLHCRHVE